MRVLAAILSLPLISAFAPSAFVVQKTEVKSTNLMALPRREALASIAASVFLAEPVFAYTQETYFTDEAPPTSQQAPRDKIDVNSAFVGDYKRLQGMYPHAAGMIASHGPYEKLDDLYKIDGLTDNDKKMFRKYQAQLTVLPPTRTFRERINARSST
eukprot:CAMPEP_0116026214 /NCGR_PEP_ID=MMETSP0321-20121206/13669_1 /TAXON_ID=163516 /ORGANISM="Leptocylindrus danicus var. danicus, Strain B650" /LENGTH=156 /DNA_ID=CAMNT_0003498873 /DNA_START=50 /DNA_END=520 /DNA_ORIENTATION=-